MMNIFKCHCFQHFLRLLQFSSTRIQRKAGPRDEIQWSPFIDVLWTVRMLAVHAWRTITGADEMKWVRSVKRNCGMTFVAGEKGETPRKSTQTPFVHQETNMEWPSRELGAPLARGERLTAYATEPHCTPLMKNNFKIIRGAQSVN